MEQVTPDHGDRSPSPQGSSTLATPWFRSKLSLQPKNNIEREREREREIRIWSERIKSEPGRALPGHDLVAHGARPGSRSSLSFFFSLSLSLSGFFSGVLWCSGFFSNVYKGYKSSLRDSISMWSPCGKICHIRHD